MTDKRDAIDTPVLIVGGGPIGLALALDLARHGVRSTLVEQDRGTGIEILAKAGGLNERTMEFCRRWGIGDQVSNWGSPADHPRNTYYCTSLDGHFMGHDQSVREQTPFSPEKWTKCPQYIFDPILANAAIATGLVIIRYNTKFESLAQHPDYVLTDLTDIQTGKSISARSDYVVACDGATSTVRNALEIPFEGKMLDYSLSAMLRIHEFERYNKIPDAERFMFIGEQGVWANITAVDYLDLWRFVMVGSEEKFNLDQLDIPTAIRRAFGNVDVPFELLRIHPWRRSQCAAQRFRVGRVLLAGDSAHTTSPTGAHGLNTGLGDVFGLGWMLAGILHGWGGPRLLEAYEAERRPIAIRNSGISTKNYGSWVGGAEYSKVLVAGPEGIRSREHIGKAMSAGLFLEWNSLGIVLGYRYEGSPIVVSDGTEAPPDDPSAYVPTSRPGHRAPHAPLSDGRSMLDLFGKKFVLLRFGSSPPSVLPLLAAAAKIGMPIDVADIPDAAATDLYARKLVLVRPDGHVAWRGDELLRDIDLIADTVCGRVAADKKFDARQIA